MRLWLIGLLLAAAASVSMAQPVGSPRLMQGPMIGAVHRESVLLWARLSGAFEATAELASDASFEHVVSRDTRSADKASDYCLTFELAGLEPGTSYYYRVLVQGEVDRYSRDLPVHTLRTAPEGPAKFRLAMGSCARFGLDRRQPIWRVVAEREPDLFFWMGDNMYGDALDPDILAEEYRRQRDLADFQPVMARVPQLAIWDDHDFGLNDYHGGHPAKAEALRVFRAYWPNGSAGTAEAPGVYFQYRYGGVDFFMLDCRYHRSPNEAKDGPDKTMLGKEQLAWLIDGLRESEAPFKVLVCGSGWTLQKGPTGDSWAGFAHEREELFGTIMREKIGGVVLMSGDTHLGELNVIHASTPGGYDLYDLVSSPLAQRPNTKIRAMVGDEERVRPGYPLSPNVGIADFDMTGEDPVLRFNLVDVWGRDVWTAFELRASALQVR